MLKNVSIGGQREENMKKDEKQAFVKFNKKCFCFFNDILPREAVVMEKFTTGFYEVMR